MRSFALRDNLSKVMGVAGHNPDVTAGTLSA
jgi:hypothetical protein